MQKPSGDTRATPGAQQGTPQKPQPRQRVRLPFEPRRKDPGVWSYIHRHGIAVTVILYLLVAICFVWAKIAVGPRQGEGMILVDIPEEKQQMRLTPEEIDKLEAMMREDFANVQNRISNDNAELNDRLRDAKGTNASELYNDANALSDQMAANREAYEEGLRRIEEMRSANRGSNSGSETTQDTKVKGRVTVSFSFTDPVRSSQRLVIPAYMCEGGGQVVVNATLDNNGFVTSATVERGSSTTDNCMQSTAVQAALSSRFNMDTSAPAKHRGTITYIFIPQ